MRVAIVFCLLTGCTFSFNRSLSPGQIRGRVVFASSSGEAPAAGASVTLENSPVSVVSDSSGDFAINNLTAGTYAIDIAAAESSGQLALRLTNLVLNAADGLDLGVIELGALGGISGTVTMNGSPVDGAVVVLTGLAQTIATDGGFQFDDLPQGSYSVSAVVPMGSVGAAIATPLTVTVTPRGKVQAPLELNIVEMGSLSGSIAAAEGSSAQGVMIQASSPGVTVAPVGVGMADTYAIASLPAGLYSVTAEGGNFSPVEVPYLVVGGDTTQVPTITLYAADAGFDAGPEPDAGPLPDSGPVVLDGGPETFWVPDGGFCTLPGSYVATATSGTTLSGTTLVGTSPVDLSWMLIPPGMCVHYFGNVGNARKIRIAPGGELFVASPTEGTTSGGANGQAALVVLADDNHDGYADSSSSVFLSGLPETAGLMFTPGWIYYQDDTCIRKLPYVTGERVSAGDPSATGADICAMVNAGRDITQYGPGVIDITEYVSDGHWPKAVDVADDGTIYVTNGGDQGETCYQPMPTHGGIWEVDGTTGGMNVVKGLRNAIDLRCQRGHDACYGVELALDYSSAQGGREKLIPINSSDNYGYPCCATADLPYSGTEAYEQLPDGGVNPVGMPDCSGVTAETGAFVIGETPFGLDFDYGHLPAPYTNNVLVALHGAFGSWVGARVVAVETDSQTGAPLAASDLDGGTSTLNNFATGWDDGMQDRGRPTDITTSPDGRIYLSNDQNGDIIWFAPVEPVGG